MGILEQSPPEVMLPKLGGGSHHAVVTVAQVMPPERVLKLTPKPGYIQYQ